MPMTKGMDVALLGSFSPFNALKSVNLAKLLDDIEILQTARGQALFNKGDLGKRAIYLLSGTVSLRDGDQVLGKVTGGTEEARNAIGPGQPRRQSAIALDDVRYFAIDSELLDVTLTLDQTGIYEVGDFQFRAQ